MTENDIVVLWFIATGLIGFAIVDIIVERLRKRMR